MFSFEVSKYISYQGCIKAAADILDKLNTNVDPCDDFYEFACRNFKKNTVIPDDRSRSSMFSVLGDKLNEQVSNMRYCLCIIMIWGFLGSWTFGGRY